MFTSRLDAYISRYGDFLLTTTTTTRPITLPLAHAHGVIIANFATTYTSNSNSELSTQSPVTKPGKTYHMRDIRCNRLPYRVHTCAGSCYNVQGARDRRSYSLISIFSTAGKIWVPWDKATQASIPSTLHAIARASMRMCPYMEVRSS